MKRASAEFDMWPFENVAAAVDEARREAVEACKGFALRGLPPGPAEKICNLMDEWLAVAGMRGGH